MNTDVFYCFIAGKYAANKLINLVLPFNRTKIKEINIILVHLCSSVDNIAYNPD